MGRVGLEPTTMGLKVGSGTRPASADPWTDSLLCGNRTDGGSASLRAVRFSVAQNRDGVHGSR